MPRITLPMAGGGIFDSWDQANAGRIQVYWLGDRSPGGVAEAAPALSACDAELHLVAPVPQPAPRLA